MKWYLSYSNLSILWMILPQDVLVLVHALHAIHQVLEVGTVQGKFEGFTGCHNLLSNGLQSRWIHWLINFFLRSYSPAPRRRGDSVSPIRRRGDHPRSPRDHPRSPLDHPRSSRDSPLERGGDHERRPYSPGYDNGAGQAENGEGYDK